MSILPYHYLSSTIIQTVTVQPCQSQIFREIGHQFFTTLLVKISMIDLKMKKQNILQQNKVIEIISKNLGKGTNKIFIAFGLLYLQRNYSIITNIERQIIELLSHNQLFESYKIQNIITIHKNTNQKTLNDIEQDRLQFQKKKQNILYFDQLQISIIPHELDNKKLQSQIDNYIKLIHTPKSQINLFCQQLSLSYPQYKRKYINNLYYVQCLITFKCPLSNQLCVYCGNGKAANYKFACNQASLQVLKQIYYQKSELWKKFIKIKMQKHIQ